MNEETVTTTASIQRSAVSLDDKYAKLDGRIYLSGIQALVRLPMMQRLRDQAIGLNTAGFVSGYRGSPLGTLDEALWKAQTHLSQHHVKFVPGVNEELAATAVWGTQTTALLGPAKYDGVFAMWYAKGPGVDRCADVFKHMNHAGTAKHGGVLLVAGDDHGAYSSTLPHQSDHLFSACMVPMLYPCNVQEYLDLGLHAWAMSRFSGCAIGFKALADTVESTASVDANPFRIQVVLPEHFPLPPGGLNNRLSVDTLGVQARAQEALMQDYKIYAAIAYARANRLNRTMIDSPHAKLGIIASGKSYLDVLEALEELGIDEQYAAHIGIRVYKVAMPWPLEPEGIREFSQGLEEILVVEEKRQIVEYQLKEQLYNWREDVRPRVIGKFDEKGEWVNARGDWLLTAKADFSVAQIARVIASRIARFHTSVSIQERLQFLQTKEGQLNKAANIAARPAYYCAGCPHNTSTRVPTGSLALAGIGCHVMATSIFPESNKLTTHMGGEGAPWIGQSWFSKLDHVFQNLGDGTYFHSGSLAIRAAIAAQVNITYKILYNDAVAMTGGQPVDGSLSVFQMAAQLSAEGVQRIALLTEDVLRYADRQGLPTQVTVHDRSQLELVQTELREYKGVSVLIYDQVCASEKRRRQKKGEIPLAVQRLFINEAVCEACGDCGEQSNCTAIVPKDTSLGRKRAIDQSNCNTDFSCVKGFCPSFVSVHGGKVRSMKQTVQPIKLPALPDPVLPGLDTPYNILINGIGGTGVITIGSLLGMAAHLEGKGVSVLDMTGMSQKNGSVSSHVRIAAHPQAIRAQRIASGEADLVLGCDMLTAATHDALSKMRTGRTHALINTHQQPIGAFARQPDWMFPAPEIQALLQEALQHKVDYVDASRLATALTGDAISTNVFMLGFAYQKGLLPVSAQSLLQAMALNGVSVASNQLSFEAGRHAAFDLQSLERLLTPAKPLVFKRPIQLEEWIARHVAYLTDYQNASYADHYVQLIEHVRQVERQTPQAQGVTLVVAHSLFKLMAYKDEYEVARLFTCGDFETQLKQQFEGRLKLRFHLAPPVFSKKNSQGLPVKSTYGPWVWHAMKALAKFKGLRGTRLDPFGWTAERQMERQLIKDFVKLTLQLTGHARTDGWQQVKDMLSLPHQIRGFGHVKLATVAQYRQQLDQQLEQFYHPRRQAMAA